MVKIKHLSYHLKKYHSNRQIGNGFEEKMMRGRRAGVFLKENRLGQQFHHQSLGPNQTAHQKITIVNNHKILLFQPTLVIICHTIRADSSVG